MVNDFQAFIERVVNTLRSTKDEEILRLRKENNSLKMELYDLRQIGDQMQSASSRLESWVSNNLSSDTLPYEEGMAMLELGTAIRNWTRARRRSIRIRI